MRLSDEEAWQVLSAAHTGILTTLRADGSPVALPMWFVALDGRIYVATPDRAKKVARVRRNPRVSFLVESGERWVDLVGVHVGGTASVVADPDVASRVREAMDDKYAAFRPDARRPDLVLAVLEIIPDGRLLTWDNSRLKP